MQPLCGCADAWLSGWGRRSFHNTSLEKRTQKLYTGTQREDWIWKACRDLTLDSLNHSSTRALKPTHWPGRARYCMQRVASPPTNLKMHASACVCTLTHTYTDTHCALLVTSTQSDHLWVDTLALCSGMKLMPERSPFLKLNQTRLENEKMLPGRTGAVTSYRPAASNG